MSLLDGTKPTAPGEGYHFRGVGLCRGCKSQIYWWLTPTAKKTPAELDGSPHWAVCPAAGQFRRRR